MSHPRIYERVDSHRKRTAKTQSSPRFITIDPLRNFALFASLRFVRKIRDDLCYRLISCGTRAQCCCRPYLAYRQRQMLCSRIERG